MSTICATCFIFCLTSFSSQQLTINKNGSLKYRNDSNKKCIFIIFGQIIMSKVARCDSIYILLGQKKNDNFNMVMLQFHHFLNVALCNGNHDSNLENQLLTYFHFIHYKKILLCSFGFTYLKNSFEQKILISGKKC